MAKYSFEFKKGIVTAYKNGEGGHEYLAKKQELALSVGINNPPLITKWVNAYRIAGPEALKDKVKGRRPAMAKPKKEDLTKENAEYLKQLESENLKLRIENAYLKELRRLRLEDEARQRERLALSTASEEILD